ncbi:hypothetical protein CC1G_11577 [Coprinopsis cinerea okayama7|uniref:Transposase domain-containing protein n=1 Tax=Coprinopsis cinerea (strain Okayama-7 / 130 / ATCC MYA-4618 / FGSC 9003) TaxID=240176 RepID=A8N9S4_COPC7|nr:hypothetical protein CC1G_11577 [Coprinopsis cinerea okayama7\|eukprot:XP_001831580.2 hypothetical protein CC1G_11577 [Coprinopsis cinerea okayama7\
MSAAGPSLADISLLLVSQIASGMPSNKKIPCEPCTQCNGRLRNPLTVKKHRERREALEQASASAATIGQMLLESQVASTSTASSRLTPEDDSTSSGDTSTASGEEGSSSSSDSTSSGQSVSRESSRRTTSRRTRSPSPAVSPSGEGQLQSSSCEDSDVFRPSKRARLDDDPNSEDIGADNDRLGLDVTPEDGTTSSSEESEDETMESDRRAIVIEERVPFQQCASSDEIDERGSHDGGNDDEVQVAAGQPDDEEDNEEEEEEAARIAAQQREEEVQEQLADEPQVLPAQNPGEQDPTLQDEQEEDPYRSQIQYVLNAQDIINRIRAASLDNDKLPPKVLHRLRNPRRPRTTGDLLTPDERTCLQLYISLSPYPQDAYISALDVIVDNFGMEKPLSLYKVRKLVEDISGVVPVYDDMCVNSCYAFVGQFADLDHCPHCNEPRWNQTALAQTGKKIPRQRQCTIPLGPQCQTLRASEEGAAAMSYRHRKVEELLRDGVGKYDDMWCGEDLLDLTEELQLTDDDITVGFSLDGAQLFQNKKSDTWIGIWVIYEYDPMVRYKRKHVLPAVIIPGPKKPKNLDSFLFRSFYHLSALQRENNGAGIRVYNRAKDQVVNSRIIFITGTADAKALVELDGRVGHHGAHGCRVGCEMKGRHKGSGHYYAAHLRPNNYNVEGCMHGDYDFTQVPTRCSVEKYEDDLKRVVESEDQAAYEENRKETGISKPSIISGLHPKCILSPPKCFGLDIMHLFFLNITEFFASLFRGKLRVEGDDLKSNWRWRKLIGTVWKEHGKLIVAALKHFPDDFERPPRDPTEKMNSGYKAMEWHHWFYNLGPAFFRLFLPADLWEHFCGLVRAVRLLKNRVITPENIQEAQQLINTFVRDFEFKYYGRNPDRLHFCRPSLHTLLHAPSEVVRFGPGAYTDQYLMERSIGELGGDVRQPGTPFANLAQVAVRKCQINSITALYPEFRKEQDKPSRYATDLGDGYMFLPVQDRIAREVDGELGDYLKEEIGYSKIRRFGRLRLPNEQVVRSRFSEDRKLSEQTRISRMVKLLINGETYYGEVQLYFRTRALEPRALVLLFSTPDRDLWERSKKTLWACTKLDPPHGLRIVEVSQIQALVSMQPLPPLPGEPEGRWFPVEKSFLEGTYLPPDIEDEEEI